MTKYEIFTDDFEFRFSASRSSIPAMSADEVFETYRSCDTRITSNSLDPVLVASFDDEAEARAAFERDFGSYGQTRAEHGSVFWLLRGQLAYLEQNEYDEDGEFDQCGGILMISAAGYTDEESPEEITYGRALVLNESEAGLDLTEISLDNLMSLIDEVPGWDYPLAQEFLHELARRAGIDTEAFFGDEEQPRDFTDLCQAACDALGISW